LNGSVETIVVPKLATITIDSEHSWTPLVEIVLDDDYLGDLNDLEADNPYPERVFFRGDHASSINDPDLVRFMEVLRHWDHDGDGTYDADHVMERIEKVLWRHRDSTEEFRRPSGTVYTDLLMRFMPPAPERHIVFSYGELKPRFKRWHYLLAIPALAVVLGLVNLQIFLFPVMRHSVLTMVGMGVEKVGLIWGIALLVAFILVKSFLDRDDSLKGIRTHSKYTYGFFNKAAVYEEQAFREGAEKWNASQRTMSCLVFGAIHMTNLWYPLASILPLSLGGALFMWVYLQNFEQTRFRRTAVLASSVVHRVYNKVALTVIVIAISALLGTAVLGGLWVLVSFLFLKLFALVLTSVRQQDLKYAALKS
jgi:hypothetical protein